MASSVGHQTLSSLLKSKPPVPYANMLRQVTNHVKKLQEELQAEAETNIEFEDSSRRTFEYLTQQLKALKQAFNTLSDTLLEELENISAMVTEELAQVKDNPKLVRVEERQEKFNEELQDFSTQTFDKLKRLAEQDCFLESKVDQLNSDMDTVLQVIPKIEDSFLKGDRLLNERQNAFGTEMSKINDLLVLQQSKQESNFEKLEQRFRDMNLEFDEKILRCQKSLQQQMEYVSRLVLVTKSGGGGQASGEAPVAGGKADLEMSASKIFDASSFFSGATAPAKREASALRSPFSWKASPEVNKAASNPYYPMRTELGSPFASAAGGPNNSKLNTSLNEKESGEQLWSSNIGQSGSARFMPSLGPTICGGGGEE
ncbi:unnamed protein product [Amoebophrya sp. A120]|nr:unnamed protein product [Amoebophrya sp. A120]|eukprot:GSA120T00022745001.1